MSLILRHRLHFVSIAFVLLALLGTAAVAQESTPDSSPTPTQQFDIPPEIAGHESEWPLGNHDYANTRAAVDSAISAANVSSLGIAWTYSFQGKGTWGAASGSPVISDGVVYFQDLGSNIYAVRLDNGEAIWQKDYNNSVLGPGGPGIGYGKVFGFSRIDRFTAWDMDTGEELWSYDTYTQLPAGSFQPSIFNHRAYVTTQAAPAGHGRVSYHSYQGGATGMVFSLDPDTGELHWQWQVVEEGFWGNPELNSGGGIWYPPAIDVETGVTYWATGNPAPFAGVRGYPNGSSRPGPNLYTNSLVALDQSGEMRWYNQVHPHDLFNLDFQAPPILATVSINGEDRDIVIGSGKGGRVVGFDRETGETLWDTPIGLHQNDELQELPPDETVWVAPGAWGGVETPMAYADGVVYALTTNLPSPYHATMWDAENGEQGLNRSEGGTLLANGTAEIDALDAATGQVLWRTEFDRVAFGGVTLVNDLLFTITLDGTIYALSRADGSIIWEYQAPDGTNAWPAVSGDTIVWPIGLGDHPMVIALRLGANQPTPTPQQQHTPVHTPQGL